MADPHSYQSHDSRPNRTGFLGSDCQSSPLDRVVPQLPARKSIKAIDITVSSKYDIGWNERLTSVPRMVAAFRRRQAACEAQFFGRPHFFGPSANSVSLDGANVHDDASCRSTVMRATQVLWRMVAVVASLATATGTGRADILPPPTSWSKDIKNTSILPATGWTVTMAPVSPWDITDIWCAIPAQNQATVTLYTNTTMSTSGGGTTIQWTGGSIARGGWTQIGLEHQANSILQLTAFQEYPTLQLSFPPPAIPQVYLTNQTLWGPWTVYRVTEYADATGTTVIGHDWWECGGPGQLRLGGSSPAWLSVATMRPSWYIPSRALNSQLSGFGPESPLVQVSPGQPIPMPEASSVMLLLAAAACLLALGCRRSLFARR